MQVSELSEANILFGFLPTPIGTDRLRLIPIIARIQLLLRPSHRFRQLRRNPKNLLSPRMVAGYSELVVFTAPIRAALANTSTIIFDYSLLFILTSFIVFTIHNGKI